MSFTYNIFIIIGQQPYIFVQFTRKIKPFFTGFAEETKEQKKCHLPSVEQQLDPSSDVIGGNMVPVLICSPVQ